MSGNRHVRRAKIEDANRIYELNKASLGYDYPVEKTRARLETVIGLSEHWAKQDYAEGVRLTSGITRADAHKFYLHCGYIDRKDQKNFVKYLM